ncbi:hypothetical protein MHBO_003247 [Bonamia ostreae]|uniref:FAD synthase n=1 Tax=Bonamia ostreae TaxID=126728 RepID=A0ABV2APV9_9EUKA
MLKSFSIGVKDTNSRIARSINIIKRNLDKYRSDELAVCFNGGKDSTVLMFLLFLCYKSKGANLLPKELRVVCVTEEREFEDLRIFRERVSKIRKFAITYLPPPMKKSLNDLVRSDKIRAVFSGQRVGDPGAKNIAEETPSDNGYEPFLRINPILRWSHGDVWDFIKANRVPYCELYRKGYTSLGIPPFSLKNPFLSQGPNRFYPAWDLRLWETERMGRGVPLRDFNGLF